MLFDFSLLREEMARCRAAGMGVQIWWRDDDTTQPTAALDRLLALADTAGCPVHLAIIPKSADPRLSQALDGRKAVPIVHGWAHVDHSLPDEKKAEFGRARDGAAEEIARGLTHLQGMFGPRLLPVFVPPWNRLDPSLIPAVRQAGYSVLSTFGSRAQDRAVRGLEQVNAHIDPIFWKGDRSLRDPEALVALTAQILAARRTGTADAREPLGLLTHHLVHTEPVWQFAGQWLTEMLEGGATVRRRIVET